MKGTWRMATINPRMVALCVHWIYNWRIIELPDGTVLEQHEVLPPFYIPVRVA